MSLTSVSSHIVYKFDRILHVHCLTNGMCNNFFDDCSFAEHQSDPAVHGQMVKLFKILETTW